MKRFVIAAATVAVLAIGCLTTKTAEAHGPGCRCSHCCGHYHGNVGYRVNFGYTGYTPYNVYRAPFVPYGVGYAGGWQPYQTQQFYYQQPRFGLYLGY